MNKNAGFIESGEFNPYLDSILNSLPSPMAFVDVSLKIMQFNHLFLMFIQRVFNVDVELGMDVQQCFEGNPENKAIFEQNLLLVKKGEAVRFNSVWGNNDGSSCFYSNTLQPVFSLERKQIGFIFVIQDVSNQKQAEKESYRTAEKFRVAFEYSIVPKSITSIDGKLQVNQAFSDILGYSKEELNQMNWSQITHKDDLERNDEIVKSIMSGTVNSAHWEKRYIHKNGHLVWAHVTTALVRDEDGIPLYYISEFIDITRQKEQEQALRESEARYRLLAENSTDVIWEIGLDKKFKYISPSVFQLRGFTVEEVMNQSLEEVVTPESLAVVEQGFADACRVYSEGGKVSAMYKEIAQPCKDGSIVWTEVSLNLLFDEQGQLKGFIGNSRNINDRKKAQDALLESEKLYKHLVSEMPDGVYKSTPDGHFVEVNPALVTMLGYENKAELMSVDIITALYFRPEDREYSYSNRINNSYQSEVYILKKKDGSSVWVEDHGWYVKDESGNILFHEGILRDVTERKKLEEAKELDHSLLSATLESTGDGLLVVNLDGLATIYNRKFLKMWNVPIELLDEAENGELLHFLQSRLSDSKKFIEKLKELHRYPELSSVDNLWLKDERVLESHSMPQWLHGQIIGRVWSFRDITERIKAEKELNANRELLEKLLDLSNRLSETDLDKFRFDQLSDEVITLSGAKYCFFNLYDEDGDGFTTVALSGSGKVRQEAKKYLGFELIGKKWNYKEKGNRKIVNKILTEFDSLQGATEHFIPKSITSLIQSVFNFGKVVILRISSDNVQVGDFMLIFEEGSILQNKQALELFANQLGIFISNKRIQEKIQKSEENYRLLFKNMVNAFAYLQIVTDKDEKPVDWIFLEVNSKYEEFIGCKHGELDGRSYREAIPKADQFWIDTLGKVALGGEDILMEGFSVATNKYLHVGAYSPEYGKVVIVFTDITERKKTEEALEQSEANLSEALNLSKAAFWEYDYEKDYFLFNDQFYRIYNTTVEIEGGYLMTPEEYVKRFVYFEDIEFVKNKINTTKEMSDPTFRTSLEHRIVCHDGTVKYISVNLKIKEIKDGKTVSMIGSNQDITELKQAEAELKERMEEVMRFNHLTVDRELMMIQLKKEINELLVKLGLEPKYRIVW